MNDNVRGDWIEDLDEEDEEILQEVWAEISAEEGEKQTENENSDISQFERLLDLYLQKKGIKNNGD